MNILSIKELAARYGVHRNTASKWLKDVDRTDFWLLRTLTIMWDVEHSRLDLKYKGNLLAELLMSGYGEDITKQIYKKYGNPLFYNDEL